MQYLGFLLAGSYADREKKRSRMIGIPIILGSLYAVSDELHQLFVPGRSCELMDMLIDSSGGSHRGRFAALFFFAYWANRKPRRR